MQKYFNSTKTNRCDLHKTNRCDSNKTNGCDLNKTNEQLIAKYILVSGCIYQFFAAERVFRVCTVEIWYKIMITANLSLTDSKFCCLFHILLFEREF